MALLGMLSLQVRNFPSQLISRLLRAMFASTTHWTRYDPFFRQKDEAFKSSKAGVLELAERFREFAHQHSSANDLAQRTLVFVRPRSGSPNRANLIFNFRKKWRTFVYGAMLRTSRSHYKVML
jgi:hypothetical protein